MSSLPALSGPSPAQSASVVSGVAVPSSPASLEAAKILTEFTEINPAPAVLPPASSWPIASPASSDVSSRVGTAASGLAPKRQKLNSNLPPASKDLDLTFRTLANALQAKLRSEQLQAVQDGQTQGPVTEIKPDGPLRFMASGKVQRRGSGLTVLR